MNLNTPLDIMRPFQTLICQGVEFLCPLIFHREEKSYAHLSKMIENGRKWPKIGQNKQLFLAQFPHGEMMVDFSMLIHSNWCFQNG